MAVGTATVSVKVKEGVEGSVSRTVNKRKVTVNPSKNGDVTKVYNGNTTYTNGVIEWTVGSVNSIDGLSVTLPTVSGATYTYNCLLYTSQQTVLNRRQHVTLLLIN